MENVFSLIHIYRQNDLYIHPNFEMEDTNMIFKENEYYRFDIEVHRNGKCSVAIFLGNFKYNRYNVIIKLEDDFR